MQLMDRENVLAALEAVNRVLTRKGQHETVTITGGAAAMLTFDSFYRPVKDIDGCDISPALAQAIEEVTWDLNLAGGWFNNDANQGYSPTETVDGPQLSNLSVKCPTKLYQLCLKIMMNRSEEKANDTKDVRFMLSQMPEIQNDADWMGPYEKWFGKRDWNGPVAEAVHQTLLKTAGGTEGGSSSPPEPLLIALVNQSEWKKREHGDGKVHVFTDPPEEEAPPTNSPFRQTRTIKNKPLS